MAALNEFQSAVKRERERVITMRDECVARYNARIATLEALLLNEPELPFPPHEPIPLVSSGKPGWNGHTNGVASKTFAGVVRDTLAEIGSGRAAKVAKLMEQKGVPQRYGRALVIDVTSELIRMAKRNTGGVQRVRRGVYRIRPATGP